VLEKPASSTETESSAPIVPRRRTRAPRSTSNPAELIAAGLQLFALHGPADVSIRQIAAVSGCSHTLVGRHFGSKTGLEHAVVNHAIQQLSEIAHGTSAHEALWRWSRLSTHHAPLLTRCVLGELEGSAEFVEALSSLLPHDPRHVDITQRFGWYLGLCATIGAISLREFLLAAYQLEDAPDSDIERHVLDSADALAAFSPTQNLETLPRRRAPKVEPTDFISLDSRTALITATMQLLGATGPASLTTRAISERAQANQGLIYHYFGSQENLFATAISESTKALENNLSRMKDLDLDQALRINLKASTSPLLARLLANGADIRSVRSHYPVADRLIAEALEHSNFSHQQACLRAMVAAALPSGAVLGGNPLRTACGLRTSDDLAGPMSEALRFTLFG